MNDIFEEIERVGRTGSRGMGKRLRSESVKDVLVAASLKGRRRRTVGQGVAFVTAAGVVAVGAWLLPARGQDDALPGGPTPWDGSMTGAVVGEVDPVPDIYTMLNSPDLPAIPFCAGLYDPPTDPGLTIRDESVRALEIRVDTAILGVPPTVDGQVLNLTSEYLPTVGMTVSWAGDRHLQMNGYAVLVFSDGVMRSVPLLAPGRGEFVYDASGNPFSAWVYSDEANRTDVTVEMVTYPYDCVLHGPDGEPLPMVEADMLSYEVYAQYDGEYTLHVVVQLSDEDGVPLATFVDAVAVGATPIHVEEPRELWTVREAEYAQAIEMMRERVDAEGIPLAETLGGVGMREVAGTCQAADVLWGDSGGGLKVIDAGVGSLDFPTTVSITELGSEIILAADAEGGLDDDSWYVGATTLLLRRVTPDGVEHVALGTGLGYWTDPPESSNIVQIGLMFGIPPVDGGCGSAEALATLQPGVYEAALLVRGVPPQFEFEQIMGQGDVQESWQYLGEITVTE